MRSWGRTGASTAAGQAPSWKAALMSGAGALAINLIILFAWSLIPISADWWQETILSVVALGCVASFTITMNFLGYVLALRGLQEGTESRAAHFLGLLLNGLFPGSIILLVYFINRSGLMPYLLG